MHRLFVLAALLLSAATVSAGPLPWAYSVRVNGGPNVDAIQVGHEPLPPVVDGGPERWVYLLLDTGPGQAGWVSTASETPVSTPQTVFTFGPGDWREADAQSSGTTVINGFALAWQFTGTGGGTATGGTDIGRISADGVFTSGTGTTRIDLDYVTEVQVDGQWARVRFAGVNTESGSRIEMRVNAIDAPAVPEPGTLVLGGIVLVGGTGAWWRRRLVRAG
jgi:hypothetical protein